MMNTNLILSCTFVQNYYSNFVTTHEFQQLHLYHSFARTHDCIKIA